GSVKAMKYNDPVKAMEYYSYAAYQGHSGAQLNLAKLYMKIKDFNKAKFWFDEAMKSGWFFRYVIIKNKIRTRQGKLSKDEIADAEYNIGKIYEEKEEL
ncbi:MAG: tetratricopeptide repeat protein, partial [Endozoicomonadaceae bacterium]|nr:tetratricopeptide repeat protein [Endozoicomonadaceae bacterium]